MRHSLSYVHHFVILLCLLLPGLSVAEPVGDKDGLLKRFSHKEIDQRMHQQLIKKIKITNLLPYTDKESHYHWNCYSGFRHKHIGARKHTHKSEKCKYRRRIHGRRAAAPRRAAPRRAPAAPQASSTNVQEQGVDEADFVKTDGRYLYAIENAGNRAALRIYDTRSKGDQLKQISAIGFGSNMQLSGIYLLAQQNKLAIVGNSYYYRGGSLKVRPHKRRWGSTSSVIIVDISNKARPRTLRHTILEGTPKTTRRIGNTLYMVLNSYAFDSFPSTSRTIETEKPMSAKARTDIRNEIEADIQKWTINNQLPHYRTLGKSNVGSLIKSGNFYLDPDAFDSWNLTTVLAIDLNAPDFRFESLGWFGDAWGTTVYASQKALYITSGYRYQYNTKSKITLDRLRFPSDLNSRLIHKFAFKGKGFDYRGSGAVLGNFKWTKLSSFQLDEDSRGTLRVITYNNRRTRKSSDPAAHSPVLLTALKEHPRNKQLITLSRIPNRASPKKLGKPNEQLYGARLFEDYAYFVTFRRTDPLYVVDLRNPYNLKVTGELIIPGFSDYLHPLDKGLLLGVGKEADKNGRIDGLKLSLYDIRNPNRPAEINKIVVGKRGTHSPANRDHHAFTSLAMRGTNITRVALPIALYENENYRNRKEGLHRFEVDRKQRRIKHLGAMKPPNGNSRWSWNSTDRSIIIGDKLYYYHKGNFWRGDWRDAKK